MHSADALVDAALELFAAEGARGVRMAAVARAAGASSGSLYHRFADRPALLAAMWLRTSGRFEAGYREVLGAEPTVATAVAAAAWTVDWCRSHPHEAAALQAGVRAFEPDAWDEDARAELRHADRARESAIRAAVRAVAGQAGLRRDEVAFAMLDLPLAVVRPHLQAGEAPPPRSAQLVRRLAGRILDG